MSEFNNNNAPPEPNIVERFMQWAHNIASNPFATPILFFTAFIEASFFPIPPDILLVPLCIGRPKRSLYYALVCTLGSVSGAFLGYYIGYAYFDFWGERIAQAYHLTEQLTAIKEQLKENAFGAIALAGFTPIPYKVFTIASGIAHVPLTTFFGASILSRGARYALIATITQKLGPKAVGWLKKNFNRWTWIIGLSFLILFLVWKKFQ